MKKLRPSEKERTHTAIRRKTLALLNKKAKTAKMKQIDFLDLLVKSYPQV